MTDPKPPRVLVVGGAGYFGSLLVQDLLNFSQCHIVVGGRDLIRATAFCHSQGSASSDRLTPVEIDLHRSESIEPALADVQVAICAAGPFQKLSTTLVEKCLIRGIPYVDLADDRNYVRAVTQLVQQRTACTLPAVCTGWSAVPALSGVLARIAAETMASIESIHIQIAPGNRAPRSTGTVASLLASVGGWFTVWHKGDWRKVKGWSEPRLFEFQKPIGRRAGYLVDVPDYDIFPALFSSPVVEFRVGSELAIFNKALSFLSWLSKKDWVRDWTSWAKVFQRGMSISGFLGHDSGAVGVEVVGVDRTGNRIKRQVCVIAEHFGQRIPAMPASIMTQLLLSGDTTYHGLIPVDGWMSRHALEMECTRRGFRLTDELKETPQ